MESKQKFLHGTLEASIFDATPYTPSFPFNVSCFGFINFHDDHNNFDVLYKLTSLFACFEVYGCKWKANLRNDQAGE